MRSVQDAPPAESPYALTRESLYRSIAALLETVLERCDRVGAEPFGWADRMELPVDGRDHYATRAENKTWYEDVASAIADR